MLDKLLRDDMLKENQQVFGGFLMCREHRDIAEKGYIFLVEADRTEAQLEAAGGTNLTDTPRTGRVVLARQSLLEKIFIRTRYPAYVASDDPVEERAALMFLTLETFDLLADKIGVDKDKLATFSAGSDKAIIDCTELMIDDPDPESVH